jgi:hypothetical protein
MRLSVLGIAILLFAGSIPIEAFAQSKTCPGGLSACRDRCVKAGGRSYLCPDWCRKNRVC